MIPVTIRHEKRQPAHVRRIKCFHCGCLLALRHNATKKFCPECEEVVEKARRRAHHAIKKAIAEGKMLRATQLECWDCSEPAVCYDHRDYSKPLDVQPVCTSCNNKRGPGRL